MHDALLIFSTCSDEQEAKRLARTLVEQNAGRLRERNSRPRKRVSVGRQRRDCNRVPPGDQNRAGRFDALSERLQAIHSYEVPEIIAFPSSAEQRNTLGG